MISPGTCQSHLQLIENECRLTPCGLKAALNQKGLRPCFSYAMIILQSFKAALNQKGLEVCFFGLAFLRIESRSAKNLSDMTDA